MGSLRWTEPPERANSMYYLLSSIITYIVHVLLRVMQNPQIPHEKSSYLFAYFYVIRLRIDVLDPRYWRLTKYLIGI